MNANIEFYVHVTTPPGFDSLYDYCCLRTSPCLGAPDDPEDETVMQMHGANALHSAVKSLIHAIRIEDEGAQQDVAQRRMWMVKAWTIWRWSESKLANGTPLIWIRKETVHLIHFQWIEEEQAKLITHVERLPLLGAWEAWRVGRWRLASFSLVLGDTKDCLDASRQWYDE